MKIRKLLPLLIVLALAVMLVGCASTNEPTDALSPTRRDGTGGDRARGWDSEHRGARRDG